MPSDVTLGVSTAYSRAGVVAVEVSAGHGGRAVRVDHTLRLALNVRIPTVLRGTSALALISNPTDYSARPTRVGITGISDHGFS